MAAFPNSQTSPNSSGVNGTVLGQIGTITNYWAAPDAAQTRPANATQYAANQTVGTLFRYSNIFRVKGGSGRLVGMRILASVATIATTNLGNTTAHFWNAIPATTWAADQTAFNLLAADSGAIRLGTVAFTTWTSGGAGSDAIESVGALSTPLPLIAGAAAQDLFMLLVNTGTPTPVASTIVTPFLALSMD